MLHWPEILELHSVRTVATILARRWRLGLGFASPEGAVYPPRTNPVCQAVQAHASGDDACVAMAQSQSLLRTLSAPVCHAGLRELAVPLVVDGQPLGTLLAGGYVMEDDPGTIAIAGCQPTRLSLTDVAFVEDLVGHAAREILRWRAERDRGAARAATRYSYDAIIGRASSMQELYGMLDKVIGTESTVLVQGENGTGKELIAKAIHYNSARKERRFLIQNCSAFNDNLLDSELFGHRKGAFTGAIADKQGLFDVADGGTFFLDEVGDMSPSLQVKLLRVLQEGTFTPVGDTDVRTVDVRIIAATNRDLKTMVTRGEFREDLYYRINVINLVVPPLRERRDDIPLLIEHFLRKHSRGRRGGRRLADGCVEQMLAYPWPGNVRELENEIERLVVLAGDEKIIGEELLSPRIRRHIAPGASGGEEGGLPGAVAALERSMIHDSLLRHHGNKTRAAQELKISRRNLIRLAQKYELT